MLGKQGSVMRMTATMGWSWIVGVNLLVILAIGGWIANVVKLVGLLGGEITAMFIARIVGIFMAPFGAVLGFF